MHTRTSPYRVAKRLQGGVVAHGEAQRRRDSGTARNRLATDRSHNATSGGSGSTSGGGGRRVVGDYHLAAAGGGVWLSIEGHPGVL